MNEPALKNMLLLLLGEDNILIYFTVILFQDLQKVEEELEPLKKKLQNYHDLPPVIIYNNQYFQILLIFFFLSVRSEFNFFIYLFSGIISSLLLTLIISL